MGSGQGDRKLEAFSMAIGTKLGRALNACDRMLDAAEVKLSGKLGHDNKVIAALFPEAEFRTSLLKAFPFVELCPSHWTPTILPLGNGQNASCYISHAEKPKAVIGYMTGFKGTPSGHIHDVAILNAAGYSVCAASLPHPVHGQKLSDGFFAEAERRVKSLFFSDTSPLYTEFPHFLPKTALTHSVSGKTFLETLHNNPESGIEEKLRAAVHANPFLDTAHSSARYNPRINRFYTRHATKHANVSTRRTFLGRLFVLASSHHSSRHEYESSQPPTYGESLELRDSSRALVRRLEAEGPLQYRLPQTFVLGGKDGSSCPKVGRDVAGLIGANIRECKNAGHSLFDSPEILECVIAELDSTLFGTEADAEHATGLLHAPI
jgi:hypothetical protein